MSDQKEDKKQIKIVNDDGSTLDISPVYEHINAVKPKNKKPTNVVIPGQKKNDND